MVVGTAEVLFTSALYLSKSYHSRGAVQIRFSDLAARWNHLGSVINYRCLDLTPRHSVEWPGHSEFLKLPTWFQCAAKGGRVVWMTPLWRRRRDWGRTLFLCSWQHGIPPMWSQIILHYICLSAVCFYLTVTPLKAERTPFSFHWRVPRA